LCQSRQGIKVGAFGFFSIYLFIYLFWNMFVCKIRIKSLDWEREVEGEGWYERIKLNYSIHIVNGWEPNILKGKTIDRELIRKWQIKNWKTCNYSDDDYIGSCLRGTIIGSYIILPYKNRFYLVEFIFNAIEFYFFNSEFLSIFGSYNLFF
jgi:hypothetical protein